jgi:flagellin-like protein
MKVLGRKLNRKAISPVIATLLMIAIAVAASILVYVWSMGLVGSLQGTGGQQTREQLLIEAYDARATSGTVTWTLYMRNVGPTTSVIAAVYVEGIPVALPDDLIRTFTPGATQTFPITFESGTDPDQVPLTPGAAYTVKVVTVSGAVFSYSVIAGTAR